MGTLDRCDRNLTKPDRQLFDDLLDGAKMPGADFVILESAHELFLSTFAQLGHGHFMVHAFEVLDVKVRRIEQCLTPGSEVEDAKIGHGPFLSSERSFTPIELLFVPIVSILLSILLGAKPFPFAPIVEGIALNIPVTLAVRGIGVADNPG